MGNCHLKGEIGDRLHAVLCAAGYHIQWLLRMMARKGTSFVRRDYLRLCTVAGVSTNWELAQRQQPLPPEMNKLLIRPCEVLSRVANVTILEVANNALRVLLQHRHVIIGSLA